MHATRLLLAALTPFLPTPGIAAIAPPPGHRGEECSAAGYSGDYVCLTVPVPEDRDSAEGREIELHVVVLPALAEEPAPDPVFVLMGGPGQAAADKAAYFADLMGAVHRERDLVFVDVRGTGESNPLDFYLQPEDLLLAGTSSFAPTVVARELERLRERADFAFYTTDHTVDDLDDVREALGYERINLYGASYGTRAALVYLRRHGEHVRSVVLKAVAPLGFVVGQQFALDAQRSLDRVFARCAAEPACAEAFGDVAADFELLLEDLGREPAVVEVRNPLDGSRAEIEVSGAELALAVRTLLYSAPGIASLPALLHAGARGDLEPLATAILTTRLTVAQWVYEGTTLSVLGAEDVPILDREAFAAEAEGTFLGVGFSDELLAAAAEWPHGEVDASFWGPVRSEVPVLLISGGLDPVTPPRFGEEALAHLPNGAHVVFEHGSHGDLACRPCLDELLAAFYRAGTAAELDTTCVGRVSPIPFSMR